MSTKSVYIVMAVVLAVGAWMFRYEIVGAGSGDRSPMAYRLDRWTGNILLAVPAGTRKLESIPHEEPMKPTQSSLEGPPPEQAPLTSKSNLEDPDDLFEMAGIKMERRTSDQQNQPAP